MNIRKILTHLDFMLIGSAFLLVMAGLLAAYSLSLGGEESSLYLRQLSRVGIACLLCILFLYVDFEILTYYSAIFYIFLILMLLGVLFFGTEINNSRSWLAIGSFRFQPSEPGKIIYILFLAGLLGQFKQEYLPFPRLMKFTALGMLPVILILLQGDLGTAVMYLPILGGMLWMSGIRPKVLIIILLQSVVFRLTTVYVVGNVNLTPQQVAAASGLVKGLNMFSISEDEVRQNLSSDHTIIFEGMQKDYPSTIYLYISERESVASIQWLGILYTLDDEGMVMDENNTTASPEGMPRVTGLQVTSIHVGQKLEVRNREQMQAYYDIISELELQYYLDQISEINLSDTDNLYLLIENGISVRLGTSEYMRAKIGAIRTDIPYLEQLGKSSGVLDVSTPEDAKYSPES